MVLNIKFDVEPEGFDSAVRARQKKTPFLPLFFPSEKPIISETRQARDKRNKGESSQLTDNHHRVFSQAVISNTWRVVS